MCLQCLLLSFELWGRVSGWWLQLIASEVLCVVVPHCAVLALVMVLVVLAWPEVVDLVQCELHWKDLKEVVMVVRALVVRELVVVDQTWVRSLVVEPPSC